MKSIRISCKNGTSFRSTLFSFYRSRRSGEWKLVLFDEEKNQMRYIHLSDIVHGLEQISL